MQHIEWLQQLMFGTLHHAQPGLAFILERSEETDKEDKKNEGRETWEMILLKRQRVKCSI